MFELEATRLALDFLRCRIIAEGGPARSLGISTAPKLPNLHQLANNEELALSCAPDLLDPVFTPPLLSRRYVAPHFSHFQPGVPGQIVGSPPVRHRPPRECHTAHWSDRRISLALLSIGSRHGSDFFIFARFLAKKLRTAGCKFWHFALHQLRELSQHSWRARPSFYTSAAIFCAHPDATGGDTSIMKLAVFCEPTAICFCGLHRRLPAQSASS